MEYDQAMSTDYTKDEEVSLVPGSSFDWVKDWTTDFKGREACSLDSWADFGPEYAREASVDWGYLVDWWEGLPLFMWVGDFYNYKFK